MKCYTWYRKVLLRLFLLAYSLFFRPAFFCAVLLLVNFLKIVVGSEVFTAVTLKNAVFCNIKAQFVPHRRHYVSATEPSRLILCKI
jgi:hypothetical protein